MVDETAPGVWISLSDLARMKGISRQAVLKRVKRLEESGHIESRMNNGKREVELAAYDRAVGQVGDAFKEQATESRKEVAAQTPVTAALRDAQTGKARYEAQLKALDYEERIGNLVPVKGEHGIEAAAIAVSEVILRELGSPMTRVDGIIEAARQGEPALRRFMRQMIIDQRQAMAGHLAELVTRAASEPFEITIHTPDDFSE
jgi:DNA-binding Lrp family transcriptional regulator